MKNYIVLVGHHGSDSSTSYVWLREIMPRYTIISVGKDNSYGHPTEEVLSRLRDADVQVYRTDLQGDIIAVSDGTDITITTEKNETVQTNETTAEPAESGYIGNKNTKKFHRPDCRTLPSEKNQVPLSSREEAIGMGYDPCGNCLWFRNSSCGKDRKIISRASGIRALYFRYNRTAKRSLCNKRKCLSLCTGV